MQDLFALMREYHSRTRKDSNLRFLRRQGKESIYPQGSITLGSEPPEPLHIVLGRNPGVIRGRVRSENGKPLLDTTVVLVPEPDLRANLLLYRSASGGDDGTFELTNIAPGNYKLFAWDGALMTAWMNADFLKEYEQRGMPIKVEQREMPDVFVNVLN